MHGENHRLVFATAEVTGWRPSMEDSLLCALNFPDPDPEGLAGRTGGGHADNDDTSSGSGGGGGGGGEGEAGGEDAQRAGVDDDRAPGGEGRAGGEDECAAAVGAATTHGSQDRMPATPGTLSGAGVGSSPGIRSVQTQSSTAVSTPLAQTRSSSGAAPTTPILPSSRAKTPMASPMRNDMVCEEVVPASETALFGVFDGHGGSKASLFCAQRLPHLLAASEPYRAGSIDAALTEVFVELDAALNRDPRSSFMKEGTTALVAACIGSQLVVANAGDSRAVLVAASGEATILTQDHHPQLPGERARIEAFGSRVVADPRSGTARVDGVLAVSRALGDFMFKDYDRDEPGPPSACAVTAEPDVVACSLMPGEHVALILACDGVWDVLTAAEAAGIVRPMLDADASPSGAAAAAAALVMAACPEADAAVRALPNRGTDNMSVIIVAFKAEPGARTASYPVHPHGVYSPSAARFGHGDGTTFIADERSSSVSSTAAEVLPRSASRTPVTPRQDELPSSSPTVDVAPATPIALNNGEPSPTASIAVHAFAAHPPPSLSDLQSSKRKLDDMLAAHESGSAVPTSETSQASISTASEDEVVDRFASPTKRPRGL
ncbi:serine/threonine protein phosphatase, partial [Thecamonas trahens ATCC 50062]